MSKKQPAIIALVAKAFKGEGSSTETKSDARGGSTSAQKQSTYSSSGASKSPGRRLAGGRHSMKKNPTRPSRPPRRP